MNDSQAVLNSGRGACSYDFRQSEIAFCDNQYPVCLSVSNMTTQRASVISAVKSD